MYVFKTIYTNSCFKVKRLPSKFSPKCKNFFFKFQMGQQMGFPQQQYFLPAAMPQPQRFFGAQPQGMRPGGVPRWAQQGQRHMQPNFAGGAPQMGRGQNR